MQPRPEQGKKSSACECGDPENFPPRGLENHVLPFFEGFVVRAIGFDSFCHNIQNGPMPNISWNEIRHRALMFSREWSRATREQAEKQTFWNDFFEIFGLSRRTLASFEEPVKRISGSKGFIDLFWPGRLLVEHKTAGHSLDSAESQAFAYIRDLVDSGRQDEVPRYILLSDFRRFALYDLEPEDQLDLPLFAGLRFHRLEFPLAELRDHVLAFAFIPGYKLHRYAEQDPANLKAVALMARLHDTLKAGGYAGHDLERLLVRLLFCLFAEDTGIFEPSAFELYIENRTQRDGSDLGPRLNRLFRVLDTPTERRQPNLDETLAALPYVNGQLFAEQIEFADFNADQRNALLSCTRFDWSRISPAIFGALFQEVLTPKERRHIGAHYTSERDILKVIRPLFLDNLRAEFESIKADRSTRRRGRLDELRQRLSGLRFLDPACGCGNFLVVAYRELRALELDILREQHGAQQALTFDEVNRLSTLDVNQFYGIEIEEWPVRIAEVALWLMDHQSNMRIHEAFGQPFLRLPLRNSPHIHHGDALRMDWNTLLPSAECSYVLGNPPFVGKSFMSPAQKTGMSIVISEAGGIRGSGVLDYVTAWYIKSAAYIDTTQIEVAFVSTNSIGQGEQPGILWNYLFSKFHLTINFAYQTFVWTSEARGRAHVHVVIESFSQRPRNTKVLFTSKDGAAGESSHIVSNISPYITEGADVALLARAQPICKVPPAMYGSKPVDNGGLIVEEREREELLAEEPDLERFLRPLVGAEEYLWNLKRWCFWLVDVRPSELRASKILRARLQKVRDFRQNSRKEPTRSAAATPSVFAEIRQPRSAYVVLPLTTSETRSYIPFGYFTADVVITNLCTAIPDATPYHFGILTSAMHMAWVKRIAGRLESRYRYSNTLVYNNYPWPESPTDSQRAKVERLAQAVLDARAQFPDSTLAALYDPLLMPPVLLRAHQQLDRAVERCYRPEPFPNDQARVEFLFALYDKLAAPLLPAPPRRRQPSRSRPGSAS